MIISYKSWILKNTILMNLYIVIKIYKFKFIITLIFHFLSFFLSFIIQFTNHLIFFIKFDNFNLYSIQVIFCIFLWNIIFFMIIILKTIFFISIYSIICFISILFFSSFFFNFFNNFYFHIFLSKSQFKFWMICLIIWKFQLFFL